MIIRRLLLSMLACLLGFLLFFTLYSKMGTEIGTTFWVVFSVSCVLIILSAVLQFKLLPRSDSLIFPIVILLNIIGLAQINRIDYSEDRIWDDYTFAITSQLVFSLVGLALALILCIAIRDHRKLRSYIYTSMFLGIIFLVLPLIPGLGLETYGATVWIKLGPFSAQPAEFAKLFLILFFAGYLTINRERLQSAGKKVLGISFPRLQDLGPIIVIWIVSLVVLIFQHDLGTSLLFFGLFIAILYTATGKSSWAILGLLMFAAGASFVMNFFSHAQARLQIWQDPFNPEFYDRAYNGSRQVVQGFFALASGSLFGTGIGQGYPGLTPFSNSDFIYTSLGEEFGLTGLLAILVLYLLLIERCFSIALRTTDKFGKLIACGVGFSISIQIFVVIGGITGLIPITGLTLPFISKGGSSLIANYCLIALLLIVSNGTRLKEETVVGIQNAPEPAILVEDSTRQGLSHGK
ncbi:MAG: FtsW/RodA/SpoVE family cell cycle protein [Candidatus Ancillula sp.]|jgi:cell division protein FtsW (lipid II flippase)|nr:FtsW/RodA/SpoVE family cell cycle protein [Candidatus Ancillula sp.]